MEQEEWVKVNCNPEGWSVVPSLHSKTSKGQSEREARDIQQELTTWDVVVLNSDRVPHPPHGHLFPRTAPPISDWFEKHDAIPEEEPPHAEKTDARQGEEPGSHIDVLVRRPALKNRIHGAVHIEQPMERR